MNIREIEPGARYEVESDSGNVYIVTYKGFGDGDPDVVRLWECTCPAGRHGKMCKHVQAVAVYAADLEDEAAARPIPLREERPMNRQTISDRTNFDGGDEFTSTQQVREYFTAENLAGCFGGEATDWDTAELDAMAEAVIANRWHCAGG